jgi:hypothetical protein
MPEQIAVEDFFTSVNHKLTIRNIFSIYHHRWDIIGESVQNAVDSVLKRAEEASSGYSPQIKIDYNARTKEITVWDNGIGILSDEVRRIVAPNVSLKNPLEASRGEFGVGLTFVAFASNDFRLESVHQDTFASLEIKNGYSWAMDDEGKEKLQILFEAKPCQNEEASTKVLFKPIRFPEYSIEQLEYILRRYTAIGDFWSFYKKEDGSIKITLTYTSEKDKPLCRAIPNKFWHPADYLGEISVETIDWTTVQKAVDKGREHAMPNWIGFGLIDSDILSERGREFTYYALFCRARYYSQLAEKLGLFPPPLEEEEEGSEIPLLGAEALSPGILMCKKGMPLGAVVDHPRTGQIGYWRGIFLLVNCDSIRTEPGRKKLHIEDEQAVRDIAKKIYYRLTKFSHYVIPRDPDEEFESLLRNVDKSLQLTKAHKEKHPLDNPRNRITMSTEPANEQTLIGLFHELIGAGILRGYRAHRLSASETYDGIYEYQIEKEQVGTEHWSEWLRGFPAKERKEIEKNNIYHVDSMIVEFKMRLEDIIKDFLQKTKYHPHIKLIVTWDVDQKRIKDRGWLLEELPKPKQKFHGARWRLRPSAEGQTRGIAATDVLLLKHFLKDTD